MPLRDTASRLAAQGLRRVSPPTHFNVTRFEMRQAARLNQLMNEKHISGSTALYIYVHGPACPASGARQPRTAHGPDTDSKTVRSRRARATFARRTRRRHRTRNRQLTDSRHDSASQPARRYSQHVPSRSTRQLPAGTHLTHECNVAELGYPQTPHGGRLGVAAHACHARVRRVRSREQGRDHLAQLLINTISA